MAEKNHSYQICFDNDTRLYVTGISKKDAWTLHEIICNSQVHLDAEKSIDHHGFHNIASNGWWKMMEEVSND